MNISIDALKEYIILQKELRVVESTCGDLKLVEDLLDMILLLADRKEQKTYQLSQVFSDNYLGIY